MVVVGGGCGVVCGISKIYKEEKKTNSEPPPRFSVVSLFFLEGFLVFYSAGDYFYIDEMSVCVYNMCVCEE